MKLNLPYKQRKKGCRIAWRCKDWKSCLKQKERRYYMIEVLEHSSESNEGKADTNRQKSSEFFMKWLGMTERPTVEIKGECWNINSNCRRCGQRRQNHGQRRQAKSAPVLCSAFAPLCGSPCFALQCIYNAYDSHQIHLRLHSHTAVRSTASHFSYRAAALHISTLPLFLLRTFVHIALHMW